MIILGRWENKVMQLQTESCCGVREVHNLQMHPDPAEAIKEFGKHTYGEDPNVRNEARDRDRRQYYYAYPYRNANRRFRYAIFTQATKRATYGKNFAAYITKHKLGKVITTGFNVNPNTRRAVQVWVWTVDHDKLKAHLGVTW